MLRPIPYTCDVPEPAPIRVKVVTAPPQPQPVVIEASSAPVAKSWAGGAVASAGGATASSDIKINGGEPGSIPDLASKALDSIKSAGGSPKLEDSISQVAKKALGTLGDTKYAKVGGSGAQASLQTSSSLRSGHSDDNISSLAKSALDSLDDGKSSGRYGGDSHGDDLSSLAKSALRSLDGGSGHQRTSGLSSGDKYQGDDVAALARQAIRQMEGGSGEGPSSASGRGSGDVSSLARDALRNMEGGSSGSSPRFASADYGSSETAELAAKAAQKLTASNQIVSKQPAENEADEEQAEEKPKKKKHHKSKPEKEEKEDDKKEEKEDSKESKKSDDDEGKAAIAEAKKKLKKLHAINKMSGNGFIASSASTTMMSGSHSHEGSQNDSPMLNDATE